MIALLVSHTVCKCLSNYYSSTLGTAIQKNTGGAKKYTLCNRIPQEKKHTVLKYSATYFTALQDPKQAQERKPPLVK